MWIPSPLTYGLLTVNVNVDGGRGKAGVVHRNLEASSKIGISSA